MKKKILIFSLLLAATYGNAQDKKPTSDTTKIELSAWQRQQIDALRADIAKLDDQRKIIENQLMQLYLAILDFQKVDPNKISYLKPKDSQLIIVVNK
jgi:hypothetical protein